MRGRRTAGLVAAGLVAAIGCRAPEFPAPLDVPAESRSHYVRGLDLESHGKADQALRSYRAAIANAPEFVDAHRAYQNLLLTRHRRGDLIRDYRALLDEAPGSAPRRYLLGRLWSDRRAQRDAFESALFADPTLLFANIGLGYVSLDLGDHERARIAFEQAMRLAPERDEPRQGLLVALSARADVRHEERRLELAEAILDRSPRDPLAKRVKLAAMFDDLDSSAACAEVVGFVCEEPTAEAAELAFTVLDRNATNRDFRLARDRLATVDLGDSAAGLRLLALVEERSGDPRAALHQLVRAKPSVARNREISRIRQRLLLRTGDVDRFVDEVYSRRFLSGLTLGDGAARRDFERVVELLDVGARSGPDVVEAARLLTAAGLHEPAIELARTSLDVDPSQGELLALQRELLRHRRFLAELRTLFEAQYSSDEPLSFDEVIEELREVSRASLGEDIIDPVVTREYFPIGEFLDPDPESGSGLARYFDRFGSFALIGKRVGGPPEAYVMRRIDSSRPVIDGRPVYRVVGEELLVPSYVESLGAEIAGFAFETFIALNADRVRASAARAAELYDRFGEELLDDALLRVGGDVERTDLTEPLSLGVRAHYRAFARFLDDGRPRREFPGLLLDAVEAHERAHIRDATRFLPLLDDVGGKLRLLWRHRFSVARVEAWLEERAQAVALVDARSPMAVLSSTVYFLPDRGASPPHSVGYHDLVRRMVVEIERNPERYPVIDRRYTILPQLDRLDDEQLRELGRRVLASYDD